MADEITISTRIDGVDQALADMQRIQAQIERLTQFGTQGGGGGGGRGAGSPAPGASAGSTLGSAGGPQVVYQPPPAFIPATPGGAPGSMGQAPASASPTASPSDHSEADRVQRHFASMTHNGMNQMAGMMASASGFGGEFQLVTNMMQILSEIKALTQGVSAAAGSATQAVGAIAQAVAPTAAGQAAASGGAGLLASLGVSGGVAAGLGVGMGVLGATMAFGGIYAAGTASGLITGEPDRQFATQFALRNAYGMGAGVEATDYARELREIDRRSAEIRAGQVNPLWKLYNFALGGAPGAVADVQLREIQEEREARGVYHERRVGERYLTSIGMGFGEDGTDAFGRNLRVGRVAGVMGRYARLGGLREGADFDPTYATLPEMVEAETETVGAVLANQNLGGGIGGGMGRNMEAAMRSAIMSGDYETATVLAKGLAARSGGAATMDRAAADAGWFQSMRGEVSFAGAKRSLRSAYVRAADAGLHDRDAASRKLDAGAGDFDAEIEMLQAQLQYTDDRAQAEEIAGRLEEAKVARAQARESGARYRFGLAGERLGIAAGRVSVAESAAALSGGGYAQLGLAQAGIGMSRSGLVAAQAGSLTMNEEQRQRMMIEAAQVAIQAVLAGAGGFQRDFGAASAGFSLGSGSFGLSVGGGYGALAGTGAFRAQVAYAESQMGAAQGEIDYLRANGATDDSPAVIAARTRMVEGRAAMQRAGGGFASAPLPAALTGQIESGAFSIQMAGSLPGMYGPRREMMGQQMDLLAGAIGYRQRQRAEQMAVQGHLTPEEELTYQREIMGLQGQRVGLFNEMSYGWQSRLLSSVVNAPGNFAMVAPGMAMRAAVGAGVRNPLFGSRVGDVPDFMEQAMMVGSLSGMHTPAGLAASALQSGMRGGSVRLEGPVEIVITDGGRGILRPFTGAPGSSTNRVNVGEMTRFAPVAGSSQ